MYRLEDEIVQLEKAEEEKKLMLQHQQQQQQSMQNIAHQQQSTPMVITSKSQKPSRKHRENRSRSQEWPDVPDIGKSYSFGKKIYVHV